jgi:hypothetical protein
MASASAFSFSTSKSSSPAVARIADRSSSNSRIWSAVGTGSAISQLTIWAARIPITMVSWLIDTNRPRAWAGEISAMYMGERLEANPMPTPPSNRNTLNHAKLHARPVPTAESVNRNPDRISRRRRPNRSLNAPDTTAPTKQPTRALLVAQPTRKELSEIPKNGS